MGHVRESDPVIIGCYYFHMQGYQSQIPDLRNDRNDGPKCHVCHTKTGHSVVGILIKCWLSTLASHLLWCMCLCCSGLVVYPDGPLDPSRPSKETPACFRAYKQLLSRIKYVCSLLWSMFSHVLIMVCGFTVILRLDFPLLKLMDLASSVHSLCV